MKTMKEKSAAVWGANPAGALHARELKPGTREFFDQVRENRLQKEIPWLVDVVPFQEFAGKRVLELGCGAGYDAYLICQSGAEYTGIDITPENIERTRKHLGFYGFSPALLHADAEAIPFPDASFDVVFSNGVLHHTPDILQAFQNANRVLTKDGKFYVILYHRDSVFYWLTLLFWDHIVKRGFRRRSFKERLSMIEYTQSGELPLVRVYSRWQLRRLLRKAGFQVESIQVRKLKRQDMPAIGQEGRNLWSRIPEAWLERLGHFAGWYIIGCARKV